MESFHDSERKRDWKKEKWNERYQREGDQRRFIALLDQYINTGRTPKLNSKIYTMCEDRGITVEQAMIERKSHLEKVRSRRKQQTNK
jgi:hypothetical protein